MNTEHIIVVNNGEEKLWDQYGEIIVAAEEVALWHERMAKAYRDYAAKLDTHRETIPKLEKDV